MPQTQALMSLRSSDCCLEKMHACQLEEDLSRSTAGVIKIPNGEKVRGRNSNKCPTFDFPELLSWRRTWVFLSDELRRVLSDDLINISGLSGQISDSVVRGGEREGGGLNLDNNVCNSILKWYIYTGKVKHSAGYLLRDLFLPCSNKMFWLHACTLEQLNYLITRHICIIIYCTN